MSVQVRRLVAEEGPAAQRLGWEAFGLPDGGPPEPTVGRPGWHWWAPCRHLRVLGLLTGGDPAEDPDWDALVAGRVRGVLDAF